MDKIFLENLRLQCRIGISDEERRRPQGVVVDVTLVLDLSRAAKLRNLSHTVDYREARSLVSGVVSKGEFRLLESLAEETAVLLLAKFDVDKVVVRVRKEKYSSEPSIGIEIERERRPGPR